MPRRAKIACGPWFCHPWPSQSRSIISQDQSKSIEMDQDQDQYQDCSRLIKIDLDC
jgi:hypothetical protein